MQTKEIESVGLVGVEVFFNNTELVAIKQFVDNLKKLDTSNKYKFVESAEPLIKSMVVLLEKILPKEVMSVSETYDALFKVLKEMSVTDQIMKITDLLTDKDIFGSKDDTLVSKLNVVRPLVLQHRTLGECSLMNHTYEDAPLDSVLVHILESEESTWVLKSDLVEIPTDEELREHGYYVPLMLHSDVYGEVELLKTSYSSRRRNDSLNVRTKTQPYIWITKDDITEILSEETLRQYGYLPQ